VTACAVCFLKDHRKWGGCLMTGATATDAASLRSICWGLIAILKGIQASVQAATGDAASERTIFFLMAVLRFSHYPGFRLALSTAAATSGGKFTHITAPRGCRYGTGSRRGLSAFKHPGHVPPGI
jgi:hypothetical protein